MTEQTCNMCGTCCRAIILGESPQNISRHVRKKYPFMSQEEREEKAFKDDYIFIDAYLKPISLEKAIKINPHLETWDLKGAHAYTCPFLTNENKCSIHGKKMPGGMCEGYPWYNKQPAPKLWYSPECSYIDDEQG